MTTWQGPDPEPQEPPPGEDEDGREPSPFDRPPFDRDPEAQHAPGEGEGIGDPGSTPPPMQAVGNDNIREGRVGGVMGPPHQSMGQGQGG
jgi:hypothetical protein